MNRAIYKVDLEGDEFANLVLSQTPAEQPQEVKSVSLDNQQQTGGRKRGKLSYITPSSCMHHLLADTGEVKSTDAI